jgi:hypothetical protein
MGGKSLAVTLSESAPALHDCSATALSSCPFPLISQSMLTEYFFENISSSKALVVIAILISAASLCYVRVRSDRMHRVAPPRQINGKRA